MGLAYFRVPWNIFDFLVIFGSLLGGYVSFDIFFACTYHMFSYRLEYSF